MSVILLSYLRRFPIDIVKIDKSFIDGIADGSAASALARAIIMMGQTLHLVTVAEGIEHAAQFGELLACPATWQPANDGEGGMDSDSDHPVDVAA